MEHIVYSRSSSHIIEVYITFTVQTVSQNNVRINHQPIIGGGGGDDDDDDEKL
jgi:hypothetical protein